MSAREDYPRFTYDNETIESMLDEIDALRDAVAEKDHEIKNLRRFAPSHPHDVGEPAVGFEPKGYVRPSTVCACPVCFHRHLEEGAT